MQSDRVLESFSPPLITGIDNPFKTILEAARKSLKEKNLSVKSREGLELSIPITEVQEHVAGEFAVKCAIDPEVLFLRVRGSVPALEAEINNIPDEQFIDIFREVQAALGLDKELIDNSIGIIFTGEKTRASERESLIIQTVGSLLESRTDREMSLTVIAFNAASQHFGPR